MGKIAKKLTPRGKSAARKAYDKVETNVMAAVGRSAVKRQAKRVKTVATAAGKSALIAGSLAAAGVVVAEIRNRRKPA